MAGATGIAQPGQYVRDQCEALAAGQKHLIDMLGEIETEQNKLEQQLSELQKSVKSDKERRPNREQQRCAIERATELNNRIAVMTKAADGLQQDLHRASNMYDRNLAGLLLQNRTTLQTTTEMLNDLQSRVDSLPK